VDPTVLANVKDGIVWSEIGGSCPCGVCWSTKLVECECDGGELYLCTPSDWVYVSNEFCVSHGCGE